MEIQLVRESWGENDKKGDRWVDLYVGADGSARLSRHDLRSSFKESSDDEDYEYHVNVPGSPPQISVCIASREISGPKWCRTRIS